MDRKSEERYRVAFAAAVERDLRHFPAVMIARILERVEQLALEPLPSGVRKLRGADRMYRVRVGDYRIIYEIDGPRRVVTIQRVRHRRDAYR